MASSTDSSAPVDDEVSQLYERHWATKSDTKHCEIALKMGELDGRRPTKIYAALETE